MLSHIWVHTPLLLQVTLVTKDYDSDLGKRDRVEVCGCTMDLRNEGEGW